MIANTQMSRIGSNREQRLRNRTEEYAVHQGGVLQRERNQFVRQGKDHVRISDREQLFGVFLEPAVPCCAAALWAMPVQTGVGYDRFPLATNADMKMSAQCGGSACADIPESLELAV